MDELFVVDVKYYVHKHPRRNCYAFGRVFADGPEVAFPEEYPVRDQAEATEWFLFLLDGLGTCSKWEWSAIDDSWPEMDVEFPDGRRAIRAWAREAFGMATSSTAYQ